MILDFIRPDRMVRLFRVCAAVLWVTSVGTTKHNRSEQQWMALWFPEFTYLKNYAAELGHLLYIYATQPPKHLHLQSTDPKNYYLCDIIKPFFCVDQWNSHIPALLRLFLAQTLQQKGHTLLFIFGALRYFYFYIINT